MDLSDQMVCDLSHKAANTFPPLQFHGSAVNVVPRRKVKKKQQHTIAMTIKQSWMDRLICWLSLFNQRKYTQLCLPVSLTPHFWQFSSKWTELACGQVCHRAGELVWDLSCVALIYGCTPLQTVTQRVSQSADQQPNWTQTLCTSYSEESHLHRCWQTNYKYFYR